MIWLIDRINTNHRWQIEHFDDTTDHVANISIEDMLRYFFSSASAFLLSPIYISVTRTERFHSFLQ